MKDKLRDSARLAFEKLEEIEGLTPIKSQAGIVQMVRIEVVKFDGIADDVEFCKKLLAEQNCLTLPGSCFGIKNYFRIIICVKQETIIDFAERVQEFCAKYSEGRKSL
jgi:tyrosine aminotransferase